MAVYRRAREILAEEFGLGDIHQRGHEPGKAIEHWQRALTTYRDLRAPKTAALQEKIANARRSTTPPDN